MTGSAEELIPPVIEITPKHLKIAMKKAMELLLWAQFIGITDDGGDIKRAWRVIRGSGMGLSHSGEVADAAYLDREKHGLLNIINKKYLVRGYIRFKDDFLICTDERKDEPNIAAC